MFWFNFKVTKKWFGSISIQFAFRLANDLLEHVRNISSEKLKGTEIDYRSLDVDEMFEKLEELKSIIEKTGQQTTNVDATNKKNRILLNNLKVKDYCL